MTSRKAIAAAIAASLTLTALVAIAVLLFGEFGTTEARILGTTAAIAGSGLLALPAGFLLDRGRARSLAAVTLALSGAALAVGVAAIWADDPPEALGKLVLTAIVFGLAASQDSALVARVRDTDPRSARALFWAAVALGPAIAGLIALAVWAEIDREGYARAVGSLLVLDVLFVALQPILGRTRVAPAAFLLRLRDESGGEHDVSVAARDFAAAAEQAIRRAEGVGPRVVRVERRPPA